MVGDDPGARTRLDAVAEILAKGTLRLLAKGLDFPEKQRSAPAGGDLLVSPDRASMCTADATSGAPERNKHNG